jgi:hypothetical protein
MKQFDTVIVTCKYTTQPVLKMKRNEQQSRPYLLSCSQPCESNMNATPVNVMGDVHQHQSSVE